MDIVASGLMGLHQLYANLNFKINSQTLNNVVMSLYY